MAVDSDPGVGVGTPIECGASGPRPDAEFLLVARAGPLLTAADMDGTTVNGTNADLNGPLGRSIRNLGYTVTDITSISDADVAQVTEAQYDEFLDMAELYLLEAILGNLDDVDITVGPRSEKLSQLAGQVERKIARLTAHVEDLYDYGLVAPVGGVMTVKMAEHD
jgi:hypothetical protein